MKYQMSGDHFDSKSAHSKDLSQVYKHWIPDIDKPFVSL